MAANSINISGWQLGLLPSLPGQGRENKHKQKPSKHDMQSKTKATGLNKSHPAKVSYQLWGQAVTLKVQQTWVTLVWTSKLRCSSYTVHLSLCMWAQFSGQQKRKRLVTLRKISVSRARARTSWLGVDLSFDVIGRENRLLNRALLHQIKWHHEGQHRILALWHEDHLQDRKEHFWVS